MMRGFFDDKAKITLKLLLIVSGVCVYVLCVLLWFEYSLHLADQLQINEISIFT